MKRQTHRWMVVSVTVLLFLSQLLFLSYSATVENKWWTIPTEDQFYGVLDMLLGAGNSPAWDIIGGAKQEAGGPLKAVEDELLKKQVVECGSAPVTINSRSFYRDIEISFKLRFAVTAEKRNGSFYITAGKNPSDPASKGLTVSFNGTYDGDISINCWGKPITYDLRAYDKIMPTWPDYIRIPIEKDMSMLPLSQDKWIVVRWELTKQWSRLWVDDLLAAEALGSVSNMFHGEVKMSLSPGTRISEFNIRPLSEQELNVADREFEPVPIAHIARGNVLTSGKKISSDSLPFGKKVLINNIPFLFAKGNESNGDHFDLSASLFRQANMEGYLPTYPHRFATGFQIDPARIRFRIPNARYDAMYVIAGFDGEKNRIPKMTAMFFRADGGFAQCFESEIPSVFADSDPNAVALPVSLENGKKIKLWLVKISLDPARMASFSDLDILDVELTKQVKLFRSYPDPISYGWHQGGLPSGVHVYAVTFHRPDIEFTINPIPFGHVWTDPEIPKYEIMLKNRTKEARQVEVVVETESWDKQEKTTKSALKTVLQGGKGEQKFAVDIPVKKNGLHYFRASLLIGTNKTVVWKEERNFARLAKDTRAAEWKPGEGPGFGYWSYHGGHYTPPKEEIMRLMRLAGARPPTHPANAWPLSPQWGWAGKEPLDQAAYNAYKTNAVEAFRKVQGDNPEFVTFFPEPHISRRLTAGNPCDYWGEPLELTAEEKHAIRVFMNTSKAAAEGIREAWPNTKILIPWGDPLFVYPMLRAGFPKNLIDGSGLDMIGFERLPEQQIAQMSTHRLYFLKEEYKKAGITNPLLYYVEGIFVPTEPGACTWDEQAERYHRWALLSLAYGIERFYSGWFAFDCGNYYGAEHYGGCGIQRRIPYCDPKPAYVHFATMTRMLERSKYEKWIPTGSFSVYCLKFNKPEVGSIYVLWTIRGKRPAELVLEKESTITVTDSMDNGTEIKSTNMIGRIIVEQSPIYVTGAGEIKGIKLGGPDHSGDVEWARSRDRQTWHTGPAKVREPYIEKEIEIADFGDGSWRLTDERDGHYESNNYDIGRFYGNMNVRIQTDWERKGNFLAVRLEKQEKDRKFMPYYRIIKPSKPVVIPGKASALGVWVKAASDWGRIIYRLVDAKGEVWTSIGTKDEWNCNDTHGWSSFNFDGWRYLRFELPAHGEWDVFREAGTTWWGSRNGDGIVDLPLSLEAVIIERRTHVMYVNDLQMVEQDKEVLLGKLIAEYETSFDSTDKAVALNRIRMPLPREVAPLDNPIKQMSMENQLAAVSITGIKMPDWGYDGTSCHVMFSEIDGAESYDVWVGAYPDGRGAVVLARMPKSGGLVGGLRPARKFYLWVTYNKKSADGKSVEQSKPSDKYEIELVNAFGMK